MAYTITDHQMGIQPIGVVSATQNHPLGKIVRGDDPLYGSGDFMYLLGVASTVPGSVVTWGGVTGSGANTAPSYQTVLLASTANQGCPVAFAVAANVAANYGWYQIGGVCIAAATTFAAAGPVFIGTAGQVISTVAAGKMILNAAGLSAVGVPAAGQVLLQINRPFAQGQIT